MPIKNLAKRNAYRRRYYKNNSAHLVQKVRERKEAIRLWFNEYKSKLVCERCHEDHPAVIDFHHKDPAQKKSAIATLVAEGYSQDKIKTELKKCMVLCSNCHRKEHYAKPLKLS